jgi:hypothetical protein
LANDSNAIELLKHFYLSVMYPKYHVCINQSIRTSESEQRDTAVGVFSNIQTKQLSNRLFTCIPTEKAADAKRFLVNFMLRHSLCHTGLLRAIDAVKELNKPWGSALTGALRPPSTLTIK